MLFRSQYSCNDLKKGLDYSNIYTYNYVEIPPYTFDKETGEALNKTPLPILKKIGRINLQEKIQSYADECDYYKILYRFAMSDCNDISMITNRMGAFADIAEIPNNINDYNKYMNAYFEKISSIDKDLGKAIVHDKLSNDTILKMIDERIKAHLVKKDGE